MKKILALVLAAMMLLGVTAFAEEAAPAPITLGQVDYAAHGAQCFAVITAAVHGDTIIAAYIDEFQVMDSTTGAVGVPNSDAAFGGNIVGNEDGKVLGSKKVNTNFYSAGMADHGGSTQPLLLSYEAIEAYVAGKTIAELEAAVEGQEAAAFVDTVSGATLVDTLNYVKGVIAAAKAATITKGRFTLVNKTGETVTEIYLADNLTGEKGPNLAVYPLAAGAHVVLTMDKPASEENDHRLTLTFITESGATGSFPTLSIEEAIINLLAPADVVAGATQIQFAFSVE
ncbi:MAG: hypothetical protein IJ662_04440 [Clostridia bacterium]|nr:hypothetical protein [Clostridia bacterium]